MSVRVEKKNLSRGSPFVITRLDQGPVGFGKKHLDHQNWENLMQSKRTGLQSIEEI